MRNRRSEPTGLKPLQLLLVGQREEDYFIIQDLLNSHGSLITASLDHAAGFDDAKTRLTRKPYDLVLFEHGSEHDAVQIVREIRSRNQAVPCLFLTEHAHEATIAEIIRAGACECVSRSEIQASLVRAIRSSVSLSRSERQCRDQEDTLRKLHSAVEQSADIVLITNRAGIIEYVNPAFERVTGYTRAETVGQTPRILKSGEHGPEFYRELWSTIRSGQVFRNVVVNRKKSGESYIAEKVITPVYDAEGRVTHFISNDRDISDRRLEAALFQAQKMDAIGQLAAGVAHDFNNLLMVISSYAELMQESIVPEHRLHRNLQEILSAARRAADLTRQLLAFGRKQMQSLRVLDLNEILHEISKMLGRVIGEDIELVIVPGADLGKVKLDPVQVEQVIMNLAVNSRDAMPQGGKLTIETRNMELDREYTDDRTIVPPGSYVLLQVSDTGQGIAKEHLPHIFEPFYTTKEQGKGTGLGLATIYGIVKQSGGFIWVYSQAGMGTTFKIYFPRVQRPAVTKPVQTENKGAELDMHGTETILLVEDESAVRFAALEFLKRCGYFVIEAKDGLSAVEAISNHSGRIDLMVTDVVMPGMSVGQLAEMLSEQYPDIKVLFMSGYAETIVVNHK
jgi:two-component system, cell cycle sensor histidine kinase and response regulator CckA